MTRTRAGSRLGIATGLLPSLVLRAWLCCGTGVLVICQPSRAQAFPDQNSDSDSVGAANRPKAHDNLILRDLPKRVMEDQGQFLLSPSRLKKRDFAWLIPLGTLSGLLIASDQYTMNAHIKTNAAAIQSSTRTSNAALASLGGIPAAMYLLGKARYDSHLHEGSVLAFESAADSLIVGEVLKLSLARERPSVDGAAGRFFRSAWSEGAFPSNHALVSMSMASAIAHRYPGWLTQATVYSLAAVASLPRITAEKHFPSDVFVGAALGWLIGRDVFNRRHHEWQPILPFLAPGNSGASSVTTAKANSGNATTSPIYVPEKEGTPPARGPILVPMDSWINAALTRLAALGYVPDQAAGTRPWSRNECIRQVDEAVGLLDRRHALASSSELEEGARLIAALRREFAGDHDFTRFVEVESVYTRYLGISGRPLVDGYNFGQTMINDYGRRVAEGSNLISGFSAQAVSGRFSFYLRGEYQHAGAVDDAAARLKSEVGQLQPVLTGTGQSLNGFRPIEMYAGAQFGQWSLTVGKQELWWGPGEWAPLVQH